MALLVFFSPFPFFFLFYSTEMVVWLGSDGSSVVLAVAGDVGGLMMKGGRT